MRSRCLLVLLAALALAGCPTSPASLDATADAQDAAADARASSPVGSTTRNWVDTTRGTAANGDAGASPSRALPTELWYPATTEGRDTPPDTSRGPAPLILFVHGSSGSRTQSTFLTRGLAAAGYVVAAADMPLTAFSTPGGSSDLHTEEQPVDLRFLADQLARRDGSDPVAAATDASRYLVVGHSTGGTVALLANYAPDVHDPRVAGAAALAPCACFFFDGFFTTRALPLLVMGGTDDLFVPLANNGARAFNLAQGPRDLVTLVGGTHIHFTDIDLADNALDPMPTTAEDALSRTLARYGNGLACSPAPPPGTDPVQSLTAQHNLTLRWVRAFADSVLRGQSDALAALRATPDPLARVQTGR